MSGAVRLANWHQMGRMWRESKTTLIYDHSNLDRRSLIRMRANHLDWHLTVLMSAGVVVESFCVPMEVMSQEHSAC